MVKHLHKIKWPNSLKIGMLHQTYKPLQHLFSVSATTSSKPKHPLLFNPPLSLQKWLVTHEEFRKRQNPQKESKVNASLEIKPKLWHTMLL